MQICCVTEANNVTSEVSKSVKQNMHYTSIEFKCLYKYLAINSQLVRLLNDSLLWHVKFFRSNYNMLRVWIGGWRHVEHLDPTKAHTGELPENVRRDVVVEKNLIETGQTGISFIVLESFDLLRNTTGLICLTLLARFLVSFIVNYLFGACCDSRYC